MAFGKLTSKVRLKENWPVLSTVGPAALAKQERSHWRAQGILATSPLGLSFLVGKKNGHNKP